jgi:diguanylate cyclase (GGDEF)-like protein
VSALIGSRPDVAVMGPDVVGIHEHLLASIPGVLVLLDAHGIVRFASGQVEHLGGQSVEALVGSRLADHLDPKDRSNLAWLLAAVAATPPEQLIGPVSLPFLHVDGRPRLAEAWALNRLADPPLGGFVILLLSESAYDHFDQVLASAGSSLEDNLSSLAGALRLPPVEGECFFVSATPDGRTTRCFPAVHPVPGPPAAGPWDQAIGPDASVTYTELSGLCESIRAGADGFCSVSCFPIVASGEPTASACLVVWSRELGPLGTNERAAVDRALILAALMMSSNTAEERSSKDASLDPLTGLGTRGSYFKALGSRVAAGDRPAMLYIDIDGFKDANDRLGALVGDSVLRVVARRLSSVVRPTDELARISTDEFAILCDENVAESQVVAIAQRVVECLAEPISIGDSPALKLGASVGVVLDFPPGTSCDALLDHADEAMREAKAAGRGCWRVAQVVPCAVGQGV